jgi:hypothetical protein
MKFLDNGNSIEILSGMYFKLPKPYGIKSVIFFENIVVFEGVENSFGPSTEDQVRFYGFIMRMKSDSL